MDKKEAKTRFDKADRLFTYGKYDDALQELNAIEVHYPNNHRILNAQARTLERLQQYEPALAICNRLLTEFEYEKARKLHQTISALLDSRAPQRPNEDIGHLSRQPDTAGHSKVSTSKVPRFNVKPVRLTLLLLLGTLCYLGYLPLWLGAGILAAYFILKFLLSRALKKLFTAPFKMKGQALAGADCTVHGYRWTEPHAEPAQSDDASNDHDSPTGLRHVWLDVSIIPQEQNGGFTYWEPGELRLAPAALKVVDLDSLESGYDILEVKVLIDGTLSPDEAGKYAGPQRLSLLTAIPEDKNDFCFIYYFERFGQILLDE